MIRRVLPWVVALSFGVTSLLSAQEGQPSAPQEAQAPAVTLQGEVVDPGLYVREGRHGREVEELIYDAVEGGQSLALLQDGAQALVLFLAAAPGDDPNALVYDFAGRKVKVTGTLHERGGVKGMVVDRVEALEPDATPPPDAPL